MRKIRYGVIGVGIQGSGYCNSLIKGKSCGNSELTAVCDILENRRKWAKDKFPNVKIFSDYKEMLSSGLCDVVLIETPHYLHPVIAIDAFRAGVNVLTDKPAGVYTKQVREMNEESLKYPNLKFGIMYNQRTDVLYIKAKELIDSGKLGEMKRIVWNITNWYRTQHYYDMGGWRGTWAEEGGGVLINQCPHQLDLFTWLAGIPVSVQSTTDTRGRNISVENDVTAFCKFSNGATGVFITSTHDSPGTNRLEIVGDGGKIVIEDNKLTFYENLIGESEYNKASREGMASSKVKTHVYSQFKLRQNKRKFPPQHNGIIKNFTDVLLGESNKMIAPGVEGINGLTFSNAIHLSSWLGKEVKVPFDEELFCVELEKRIKLEKGDK